MSTEAELIAASAPAPVLGRLLGAVRVVSVRHAWFPTLIFTLHLIASLGLNAYEAWPPLDMPMHFIGGIAIAYFSWGALDAFEHERLLGSSSGALRLLLVFALTCTAAVFWEFAEFVADRVVGMREQRGLRDTLLDMLLGIAGCVVFLGLGAARAGRRARSSS